MMASKHLRYQILALTLGTICSISNAGSTPPEVTIPQGKLRGRSWTTFKGREVSAFLGIRYAEPPLGNLRFANPVPAAGWNGTLEATRDGSMCAQPGGSIGLYRQRDVVDGLEDCLYLNVYTPKVPDSSSDSLLPVMVFIQGGGWFIWSSASNVTGPGFLLDKDVVLVTFNYRLGAFGFLSTGDEVASGNWGVKDQVLALKWVQQNIAYFGGNPEQVTLFGESAGGSAVQLLALSDATTGLFHRLITQSGAYTTPWTHQPRALYRRFASRLGEIFNCSTTTSDSLVACLRTIEFTDIISANLGYSTWQLFTWGPTDEPEIEGAVLTDSPDNLLAKGKGQDLPRLSGICRDEGLAFTGGLYENEELLQSLLQDFDTNLADLLTLTYRPDSGASWVRAIKSFYYNNDLSRSSTEVIDILTDVYGDVTFKYPAYKLAQRELTRVKNPQYYYSFEYRGAWSFGYVFSGSNTDRGVSHVDDLIYLFPHDVYFVGLNKTMSNNDYEMVNIMVELWTSFATTGTPTASALNGKKWPEYSTRRRYLKIGDNGKPVLKVRSGLFSDRLPFWGGFTDSSNSTI